MSSQPILVYGTASFNNASLDTCKQFLDVCERRGIKALDTARIYGESEEKLGKLEAGKKFTLDTKVPGFRPGAQARDALLDSQKTSFGYLKVDKVDIYYLHAPDDATPISETLSTMQELYQAGHFTRFGLSNFSPTQVEAIHQHCQENNYILPTVYQGSYSPVSRLPESKLFPTLRKLQISFYVYSAIAGGFLAKQPSQLTSGRATGRWDRSSPMGARMHERYTKPKMLQGLAEWHAIAASVGVPGAELAYRYMRYHSLLRGELGDGIVLGASRPEQLEETIEGIERGPLPEEAVRRIEKVWEIVESEAPSVNLG